MLSFENENFAEIEARGEEKDVIDFSTSSDSDKSDEHEDNQDNDDDYDDYADYDDDDREDDYDDDEYDDDNSEDYEKDEYDEEEEDEVEVEKRYDTICLANASHRKGTIYTGFSTQFNWKVLGEQCGGCFRAVPPNESFLLGPLKNNNNIGDRGEDEDENEVRGQGLAPRREVNQGKD